ncbi:MAG: DUF418 domain-containing protein [Beutenbergiaceae bacterium]
MTTSRIVNLDLIRGIAVLGILGMNSLAFGLPAAGYANLGAAGMSAPWDWVLGILGEVFLDQKFMALFSMLFGAGVLMVADRAQAKGISPVRHTLWRNAILLLIGLAHTVIWAGDVLVIYAIASVLVLAVRGLSVRALLVAGSLVFACSPVAAVVAQSTVGPGGSGLGEYWLADGVMSDTVGLFVLSDALLRAVGAMLIGAALFKSGHLRGVRAAAQYRRMARWGWGIGLPLAGLGVAIQIQSDSAPSLALISGIPNTIGTIPVALGYIALISLWNQGAVSALKLRLQAVGRMALTNYLSQTILGVTILGLALAHHTFTRSELAVFVLGVWVLQLMWSQAWLSRYRFGPVEWLWRSATYRQWQAMGRLMVK